MHNQFDADKNQYISDKHMEDLTKVYSPTGGKKTFNNSLRSKKRSGGWQQKMKTKILDVKKIMKKMMFDILHKISFDL